MNKTVLKPSSGKPSEVADGCLPFIKTQDPQTLQELISLENCLQEHRNNFLENVQESILAVRNKFRNVQREVQNDFTMEIKNPDYYRENMFQLEGKIRQLKENLKEELLCLVREEQEISRELSGLDRRLEDWSKPLNSRIFKPVMNSAYKQNTQTQDEDDPTSEFQKFLASSGGHTGGWEEQDHLLFLRERRKFNGRKKFFSSIQTLLPDISEEQIVAHETWFQKYDSLKQGQKEAIRKWRAHKIAVKEQYAETQTDEKTNSDTNKQKNIGYQRDIVERIKEWKRQQVLRKEEEEEMKKQEQQRLYEERMKKNELNQAKKNIVDQYKAEKLSKMQAELLAQEMKELQTLEERAKKSVMLKAFREQDQEFVEKRKFQQIQSAMKEKQKLKRLDSVKPSIQITVERDPLRVLKPTQVWSQHCVKDNNTATNICKPMMNLRTVQHLGVPAWRKGLSNI